MCRLWVAMASALSGRLTLRLITAHAGQQPMTAAGQAKQRAQGRYAP
jgi:hypothetical protein